MRPQTSGFIVMETELAAVRPENPYQNLLAAVLERMVMDYKHPPRACRVYDVPCAKDGKQWADFKPGREEVIYSLVHEIPYYFDAMQSPLTTWEMQMGFLTGRLGIARDEARRLLG